jgi:hypothetical protein
MSFGQTMVGAVLSFTVTVCEQVAVLPLPSVAVHITVVVPTGNELGALLLMLTGVQLLLSLAVALPNATVAVQAELAVVVMGPGHAMVGSVTSLTSTIKLQVAVFPEPSVAVYVTVVEPKLKSL